MTVRVDVRLLLETLRREETAVGEWVNVVGYVLGREDEAHAVKSVVEAVVVVRLQAVLLWSAGPVRLEEYERAVREREDMMR